jgi:acyl-CoA dehydrogenase
MSDEQNLLIETADRLFADLAGRRSEDFDALWAHIEQAGFPSLLIAEEDGGFGGSWGDAFAVIRLAGYHALPLPAGEAIVAAWLLNRADRLATVAPRTEGRLTGDRFAGVLHAVPWGRHAADVLADIDGKIIRLAVADAKIERQANPADEPRDTLRFDNVAAETVSESADLLALGALIRVAQIAGAMDAALAMSIAYANERVQFGKPIGKFQALQQSLAVFAEEAAAVNCAGPAACRAMAKGDAGFEIAAAKLRANMAVGTGNMIAHQVHGAIGITREFGLQYLTRRLLSWRSEFGNDRLWANRLGEQVATAGADTFWSNLTARSDAAS